MRGIISRRSYTQCSETTTFTIDVEDTTKPTVEDIADQWSIEFDLLASVGSDFHGWPNQKVQIGNLADLPNNSRAIWSYL